MTCHDFEQRWQDWLDDPHAEPADADRAMERHAANCPPCDERRRRYFTLRLAIAGMPTHAVAAPPADFADRVAAAWAAEPLVLPMRTGPTWGYRWASAAAVLLAVGLAGVRWGLPLMQGVPPQPAPLELASATDRPLADSLADLTSATIQLARATSGPATRLGQDVLDSTTLALAPPAEPSAAPAAEGDNEAAEGGELFRQFGDGIRPISAPTRRAFSFLLGPDEADRPPSNG